MSRDRFYIGQVSGQGLQGDLKPYAIPDNAFAELNNAYVFRGRVRKRFGARLMRGTTQAISGQEQIQSRLKINIGTTNGSGNITGATVPGGIFKIGQMFSVGGYAYTVTQLGTPAALTVSGIYIATTDINGNASGAVPFSSFFIGQQFCIGTQVFTSVAASGPMTVTGEGPAGTNSYDTATGAYIFTGYEALTDIYFIPLISTGSFDTTAGLLTINSSLPNTAVYFYPAESVMGLISYQNKAINSEDVVGFDTQFAYQYSSNGWERMGTTQWSGNNANFFWGTNWRGAAAENTYLYVTNYKNGTTLATTDPMYYWDGLAWNPFSPRYSLSSANNKVITARLIVRYKDRLVLLNTVENTNGGGASANQVFVNRCRYSWVGNPVDSTAFYEDPGYGGYLDAPTKEAIITAQFLKDRLIVYFESSTWELAFTNNYVVPFVWQQINTELGAESTFSQIPFDKFVLGVGNVGIHSCNGTSVQRIDDKIPDEVFKIHNDNNGVERVAGIRDYYTEMVYWTFPSENRSTDYPYNNRIITYNYKNDCWGFNDDSITAFGYFQTVLSGTSSDLTWGEANMAWGEADFAWGSPILQAKFRNVIAGNQQGYTFICDPEMAANSPSIQVTGVTYVTGYTLTGIAPDHNLEVGQYVRFENMNGLPNLNGRIYQVTSITPTQFLVNILGVSISGTYVGGGTVTRVTPIDFKTKQYNFYAEQDRNLYISKVDFLVDRTTNGECSVDFYLSSSDAGMIDQSSSTGAILGRSILETRPFELVPFEAQQERLWHPVYFRASGQTVQFRFFLTDQQAKDPEISEEFFELHAMIIFADPTSSRL